MSRYVEYFGKIESLGGHLGGLPNWARAIVGLVALPGVILLVLSIVAVIVSLAALLLPTLPVYTALHRLTRGRQEVPGVRRVEATIVE
jgi:hypothetical protein